MQNIKTYRKASGISQEKLAAILNVSQSAVTQWETGKTHPGFNKLLQLADLFGVTVDELMKGA